MTVPASDMFPPPGPVVTGTAITVEQWLANPARVTRTLNDLSRERFIADRIFAAGPRATGGAVIYDQVLENDLYAGRDVQAIEPGSEFPLVVTGEEAPLVARTIKWGGAAYITYEQRDRNQRDVLNRRLTQIRNTIVRKVDQVAIATLYAAPILELIASGDWGDVATDIFADIATGVTAVDRQDLGYEVTAAILSPATALKMLTNKTLRDQLPKENQGAPNPVMVGKLTGVGGITNWYQTNRMPDGDVMLLSEKTAGTISDEKPLYTRVVDEPRRERLLIMGARLTVPYVTDPKSVLMIRGV